MRLRSSSRPDTDPVDGPADRRPRRTIGAYVAGAVAIVAVMSMVAAIGFRSALSGWSFTTAAAVGTVGASAIVLFARQRRLLLGESVALSAVAFVLLGGIAVNGVPTPAAYGAFARGLIDGWADLLSSAPPADITEQLRALPFTVAWLAAAIGGEIARHSRRPGLPAVGPILALALSLLFTVEERWLALLQGAGILAGTLALITLAQRLGTRRSVVTITDEFDPGATSTNRRRLMFGAIVVVGAVVAAPVLGPHLPLAEAHERFDLRRYQVPPFDPLAVPSPLVQVKASLKDERRDDVVFVVSGDTEIDRWPVAELSDYDGVVWTVADPDDDEPASEFVPVDTQLPELDDDLPVGTTTVQHTVEITDLGGYFLPTAGTPRRLSSADDADPRMNMLTGTVALPGGVPDGFTYDVTSAVIPDATEAQLQAATIASVDRSAELELLPPPVRNLAADLVEGQDRGWDQMAAIRDKFVTEGFYDVTEDTPPGHSYGRISAMLEDPTRIIGYEEQYAAAAAVMARVAELPARVVVGYKIPDGVWQNGRAEVTAGDIAAWVELDAGDLGWIPVDVTPDRSRTPDPESQGATTEKVAIPNPPPPPPPPPQVEPPRQEEEEVKDDEVMAPVVHDFEVPGGLTPWGRVAVAVTSVPLVLFALFAGVVIAWKALRRRRRRGRASTTSRVAGAWAEAIDRCTETGAPRLSGTTPHETVGVYVTDPELAADLGPVEAELRRLANQVDRATFAASAPTDEHADVAWRYSDEVAAELRRRRRTPQRLRMRLDPRPSPPRRVAGRGPPVTEPGGPPDDDDDVTVPGDHELLAELRRSAAGPPTPPLDDDDDDDDDPTIDADHDVIAEIRAATAGSREPLAPPALPPTVPNPTVPPPPPGATGLAPPVPPAPTVELPAAAVAATTVLPTTPGRWQPQGRLPVARRAGTPESVPPRSPTRWFLLAAGALVAVGVVVFFLSARGDVDAPAVTTVVTDEPTSTGVSTTAATTTVPATTVAPTTTPATVAPTTIAPAPAPVTTLAPETTVAPPPETIPPVPPSAPAPTVP